MSKNKNKGKFYNTAPPCSAYYSIRTRVRSHTQEEVGGAQVQVVGQMGLDKLEVPQATSEPGGRRQAVLLDTTWRGRQAGGKERETGGCE